MLYTLERFNQYAVKANLSAGAILLWQRLYVSMQRKGQFCDVPQNTSVLMAELQITRQGLQQIRQALVQHGFLRVRQGEQQQIFYTLLLNGKELSPAAAPAADNQQDMPLSEKAKQALCEPLAQPAEMSQEPAAVVRKYTADTFCCVHVDLSAQGYDTAGDIILTGLCKPYIEQFCNRFGNAMRSELLQWMEMRRKNGWTLTLMGLEAVLKKLIVLAEENAIRMAQIVAQSVNRRWKGFFALKVHPAPSGKKLRQQEEKQQRNAASLWRKPAVQQKFKPEGRDLAFLER